MIPIPAIDLKDGKVVRLLRGDFKQEKIYSEHPDRVAKAFAEEGATRLHVVDLDGALTGRPTNQRSVEAILEQVNIPVELGGGLRDLDTVYSYFEMGVRWAVLGTKACLDGGFLREALAEFKDRLIIAVDAKDGFVASDGWTKKTNLRAVEFAKKAEGLGAKTILYTDIARDGALVGPNIDALKTMAGEFKLDLIASGGVGSLDDLKKLSELRLSNVCGAIIGKAFYEKKFSVKEAIAVCS